MMKAHHSHSYPLLSALLFFFFVTWSSSGSLLSIWLHQEVGLKAGDTGIEQKSFHSKSLSMVSKRRWQLAFSNSFCS